MNIKSRYAILLIIMGLITVLSGSVLKTDHNHYSSLLFLSGLALNFVGAIIFVINMYHKR